MNRHFSKDVQIVTKYMKKCPISLIIKKRQITATMNCHHTHLERIPSKRQKITVAGHDGKIGNS
jgi:hypothetical protein